MNGLLDIVPGASGQKELLLAKLNERLEEYERMHPPPGPGAAGPRHLTVAEISGLNMTNEEAARPEWNVARNLYRNMILEAFQDAIYKGAPKATSIRQGPKEPYPDFIDRLFGQIDQEITDQEIKAYLKQQLSINNANEDCKAAMRNLRPEDPLEDKMYACREIGSNKHKMALLAEALQVGLQQGRRGNGEKCFNCGKPGHVARQCRAPKQQQKMTCFKCGKPGHMQKECKQGNGQCPQGLSPGKVMQASKSAHQEGGTNKLYPSLSLA